tara:strand:- start:1021 stop:1461 length:441 start_codon:yes stop_codon:yes gene_type:complete
MKVLFFSNKCKFCSELITQLKDSEFSNEFKFINVDNNKVPDRIKVVPTIIDSEYKDLLEGKKAFEYLYNKKYFNIPTNNLLLWKDKIIPKPEIKEDKFAKKEKDDLIESQGFQENKVEENKKVQEPIKKQVKISKKSLFLLKGRSN